MCGIAGWAEPMGRARSPDVLREMTAQIAHRGPDGCGHALVDSADGRWCIALGHRRLAIIDIAGGAQPMATSDGTLITFNGEIYNFQELARELRASGEQFRTNSDTEVLLCAYRCWGDAMLPRLRGMFAFALWDPQRQRMLLARDRFGKKPLFVAEHRGGFYFASEIKSLRAIDDVGRRLDGHGLSGYFAYRFVPGPATLFEGIRKLQPGCAAMWENGRLREWRYWVPPDAQPRAPAPAGGDQVSEFRRRLEEAVRLRLISDVPLGAFLSGGLDSSAIVALAARLKGEPVKTFSVGFADAGYSELPYARTVAKHLRCDHHELEVGARDLMDLLPDATRHRDAPVNEPADLPIFMLSRAATEQVKVVLTGEGSDEVLGGYPKHQFERLTPLYHTIVPQAFHRALLAPLVNALPYSFRRVKTLMASLGVYEFGPRMARWFGALAPEEQKALAHVAPPMHSASVPNGGTALRRVLHFDQSVWLPDNLLERADRMMMAHGLEGRNPFLDHTLVEWVSTLPDRFRVRGLTTKWLLRQAAKTLLPDAIIRRPKVGFRLPVNEWMQGDMGAWLDELITGPASRSQPLYHSGVLRKVLDEHRQGRHNHEKLLWMALTLELFMRQYDLTP